MYAPFPTTAQEHLKRIFPRLTVLPSPPKFTPAKPLMLPAPAAPVALLPARVSGIRQRDTLTHIERVTKRQRHKIIPKKMRPLSSDHEFTFGRTAGGQSITLHENLHYPMMAAAGYDLSDESALSIPVFTAPGVGLIAVQDADGKWLQKLDRDDIHPGDVVLVDGERCTVERVEGGSYRPKLYFDNEAIIDATTICVKMFTVRECVKARIYAQQVRIGDRVKGPYLTSPQICVEQIVAIDELVGSTTIRDRGFAFTGTTADGHTETVRCDIGAMLDVEVIC